MRAETASSCSAVSSTSAAEAFARSSSTVSAPTITEATAGRDSSHAQRDLRHLQPPLACQAVELAGDRDLGFGESGAAVALVPGDLPVQDRQVCQQAAVQRGVGDDRQPEAHARGAELRLGAAVEQAVHHLGADGRGGQAAVVGDPQRLGELPGRVVGQGDVAELALPDQVVVDREGLLFARDRRNPFPVRDMRGCLL